MYEERISELNTATEAYRAQIMQFLQLADLLYKNLGLVGEVHSRINGNDIGYKLFLIDRPSTSVQIVKSFDDDGNETDWEPIDLSDTV